MSLGQRAVVDMPECALTESQWDSTALDSPHGQPEKGALVNVPDVVASLGYEVQSVTPPVLHGSILSHTNAILRRLKLTRWGLCWGLSPSWRYGFARKPAAARANQKVGRFITYELMG